MFGHWNIDSVGEFDPEDWFGFCYEIVNTATGRKYIGRKQFRSRTRKKVSGRKNRKVVVKQSNWETYTGSCDQLNEEIEAQGKDHFQFNILKLCKTKRELGYSEVKFQFLRNVLEETLPNGDRAYYNSNIAARWFA